MANRARLGMVLLAFTQLVAAAACGDHESVPPGPTAPGLGPPASNTGTLISGIVSDTAFRPLGGARVEVLDGPQAGSSAIADATGQFSLRGVFDDATRFRASKDGHVAATGTLSPVCAACNPNRWIYFDLDVTAAPVNIAGSYALTFIADDTCGGLMDPMRTRSYHATITPSAFRPHTLFELTLGDGPFLEEYNRFSIGVAGDYAAFFLGDLHGDPGLVERVAVNSYLAFDGFGTSVQVDGSTISASLEGSIEYCELPSQMGSRYSCSPNQAIAYARCAGRHRVNLTRR